MQLGTVQNAFLGDYDISLPQEFSSQADMLNDLLRQRQFQSSPNLQTAPKFGAEESPDMMQQGTGATSTSHCGFYHPLQAWHCELEASAHLPFLGANASSKGTRYSALTMLMRNIMLRYHKSTYALIDRKPSDVMAYMQVQMPPGQTR